MPQNQDHGAELQASRVVPALAASCSKVEERTDETVLLALALAGNVSRAQIARVEVILNDQGQALYTSSVAPSTTTTDDGYSVLREVLNLDADAALEARLTVLANPFASSTIWYFRIRGSAGFPPFCVVARVRSASDGVLAESASVCAARGHGLRTLIRDVVRTCARLVRHGRKLILRFAKSALRLDWINHAADRLDALARASPS